MAHWNAAIVVKNDGSNVDDLAEKALAALQKHAYEIPSAPNKRYVDQYQIDGLKEQHKTDDLETLVKLASELYWEDCFSDENGIYYMSNAAENPDGHFDYAQIIDYLLPEEFGEHLLGEGKHKVCRAIITPDGTWHEGPWSFGEPRDLDKIKEMDEWVKKLSSILEENKDTATVFLADCHS